MGLMEKDYLSEIRHLKRQLADVQEGPFSKNRDLRHKLERQRVGINTQGRQCSINGCSDHGIIGITSMHC